MIGNFLEHYDHALYGLLAPFIATYFFPDVDLVSSLIWIYSLYPLSVFTRLLGGWVFGSIGDRKGKEIALSLTLFGTAIVTTLMGFLPTYHQIGMFAPFLLLLFRMMQTFFASSETMGGAMVLLEGSPSVKKNMLSSLYDMSSMAGIFLASFLIFILSKWGVIDTCWRILFIGASITAWVGAYVRKFTVLEKKDPLIKGRLSFLPVFTLVFVSSLSYTIYHIVFVLMNGLLPFISTISQTKAFEMNTFCLLGDFFLLPLFGWICVRYTKEKVMRFAMIGVILFSLPLFYSLEGASLLTAYCIRFAWVVLGVSLSAPFYVWAIEMIGPYHRLKQLVIAHTVGSQLFGKSSSMIGLWLFKKTGSTAVLGLYPMLIASVALGFFSYQQRELKAWPDTKPVLKINP